MGKRKRQPKRSVDDSSSPPKRRRRKNAKTTAKAASKEEHGGRSAESKGDVRSSGSRSGDGGSKRRRARGAVHFATDDGDELETAKTRLFDLRQAKADMQTSLHKFQQQVKCLNEEIEELHEKLERLVARHTREQVEECANHDASRNLYASHCVVVAEEGVRNSETPVCRQEAEVRLLHMMRTKAEAKEYLRKCQEQLKTLNSAINRLHEKWKELISQRRAKDIDRYEKVEKDEGKVKADEKSSNESDESSGNSGSSVKSEKSGERIRIYGDLAIEDEDEYETSDDSEREGARVHTIYSRNTRMPSYSDTSNCTSYSSLYDNKAVQRKGRKQDKP